MSDIIKCQYCGKEIHKVNLQDHKNECSKNKKIKKLKIFSYEVTKKQYWLGVLVLIIVFVFFRFLNLSPEITEFERGQMIGKIAITFIAIFGGIYLGLTHKKD